MARGAGGSLMEDEEVALRRWFLAELEVKSLLGFKNRKFHVLEKSGVRERENPYPLQWILGPAPSSSALSR